MHRNLTGAADELETDLIRWVETDCETTAFQGWRFDEEQISDLRESCRTAGNEGLLALLLMTLGDPEKVLLIMELANEQ